MAKEHEDSPEDLFVDEEVLNVLRESLKVKLKEQRQKPTKNQLHSALKSTMGEFMSCWRLMGFDLDGNPINMAIYNNNMEKAALDNAFMQKFGEFMNGTK